MKNLFNIFIYSDAPQKWQLGFQDPATPGFTGIIEVRPLIIDEPVILITITELMLCKPIDLSTIEMRRGVQHVDKVQKRSSYNLFKGEVIFIHVSLIHLSQDIPLVVKITICKKAGDYVKKLAIM
jgi:hypothetical protein